MRARFLRALTLTALIFLHYTSACAQELSAKLLGGTFAPQSAGVRVAYILSSRHSCTGTLVAERLVLTAAHCVPPSIPASDYVVYVGGDSVGVESTSFHPGYDERVPDEQAAPYDLGMIVLSAPITDAAPVPILSGRRLSINETYYLAGYGTNEETWDDARSWTDNFKIGATTLDRKDDYLIWGTHTALGTSICAGDSGGPATLVYGNHLLLVGVASVGLNDINQGECILVQDGSFAHVDLQSSTSREFLSTYPEIRYVSHAVATVAAAADSATSTLRKASKGTSLSKLKQQVRAQQAALVSAAKFADGAKAKLIQRALKALKAANAARTLSSAKSKIKAALTQTARLSALGLS